MPKLKVPPPEVILIEILIAMVQTEIARCRKERRQGDATRIRQLRKAIIWLERKKEELLIS